MGFKQQNGGFNGGLMGFKQQNGGFNGIYPLVNLQKAIENGPVEIVDFPMKNGGSFHSYVNVHQRVYKHISLFPLHGQGWVLAKTIWLSNKNAIEKNLNGVRTPVSGRDCWPRQPMITICHGNLKVIFFTAVACLLNAFWRVCWMATTCYNHSPWSDQATASERTSSSFCEHLQQSSSGTWNSSCSRSTWGRARLTVTYCNIPSGNST